MFLQEHISTRNIHRRPPSSIVSFLEFAIYSLSLVLVARFLSWYIYQTPEHIGNRALINDQHWFHLMKACSRSLILSPREIVKRKPKFELRRLIQLDLGVINSRVGDSHLTIGNHPLISKNWNRESNRQSIPKQFGSKVGPWNRSKCSQ